MNQAEFLNELCKTQASVTIYLTNGIRLQGSIEYFDQYGVLLRGNTNQFLFKHAISTIVPERIVSQPAPADKSALTEALSPADERRPTTISRRVGSAKPRIRAKSDEDA